jgi:hypothetical protein
MCQAVGKVDGICKNQAAIGAKIAFIELGVGRIVIQFLRSLILIVLSVSLRDKERLTQRTGHLTGSVDIRNG